MLPIQQLTHQSSQQLIKVHKGKRNQSKMTHMAGQLLELKKVSCKLQEKIHPGMQIQRFTAFNL